MIIRQGEVRMELISSIPECQTTALKAVDGAFIVGESESHHHHVLEDVGGVTVLDRKDVPEGMRILYAIVENPTVLKQTTGNPHGSHEVPPGKYSIHIKREFNPFLEQARRVAD